MPHLVPSFWRSSTLGLENPVANFKKSVTRRKRDSAGENRLTEDVVAELEVSLAAHHPFSRNMRPLTRARGSTAPPRSSSLSLEEHKDNMHHRLSFPIMHFGRLGKDHHHNHHHGSKVEGTSASSYAMLQWELESPPIVFYGSAEESTGALVSGLLCLDIKEDGVEIESFKAALNMHVVHKKPFAAYCHDCTNQYTDLKSWAFLQHPLVMTRGVHQFPFSMLLDGNLPASMDGQLVSIAYEFKAEVVPRACSASRGPVTLQRTLEVKRSLPPPDMPHHSVRVFPPTNIKAIVHYPLVIHPIGTNRLSLKLDGIAKSNPNVKTVEYWKLNKLTWRLDETSKTVAPPCAKHAPPSGTSETSDDNAQAKKGVVRTETRTIGEKTIFSGWKSNYCGAGESCIELELEYALAKQARFSCDSKSACGSEVTHQLMVEMVVSQEWAPVDKPNVITQTGVGRILRMHFSTMLTERGGIGISWDNEAPPIYQDVPPRPPAYAQETALEEGSVESVDRTLVWPMAVVGEEFHHVSFDVGAHTLVDEVR